MKPESAVTAKVCPTVAYSSARFADEVTDKLREHRILAITDLPEELTRSIQDLFESGDHFFDHFHEESPDKFPAIFETNNVRGLFRPEQYPLLCNDGVRFFIGMNGEGGCNNEEMPVYHDKPVMTEAAKVFNRHTDQISEQILTAMAESLHLDPKELTSSILGGNSAIGLTRYYPITQDRAKQMYQDQALSMQGDNVELFGTHRDINPLVMLVHRGGLRGLSLLDKATKELLPLTFETAPDEPYILVFSGLVLKELTNGHFRAVKHNVITTPETQHLEAQLPPNKWRSVVSKFYYCLRDEVGPLNTIEGSAIQPPYPRKHQRASISQTSFFKAHFDTEQVIRERDKAKELPAGSIKLYPSEVNPEYSEMYTKQLRIKQ